MRLPLDLCADQYDALHCGARELLAGGEVRGGKSTLLHLAAVLWCVEVPGVQVHLLAKDPERLRADHFRGSSGLWHVLSPLQLEQLSGYRQGAFHFWNGSRLQLLSWSRAADVDRVLQERVHALLIDDAEALGAEAYAPLRLAAARAPEIVTDHWTFPRIIVTASDARAPWLEDHWRTAGLESVGSGLEAFAGERKRWTLRSSAIPASSETTTGSPLDLLPPPQDRPDGSPGPQRIARESEADIVIMGGAAYGGKTWWLETECLRHVDVPGYRFVIFRRTTPDIDAPGGVWEESEEIYPLVGGVGTKDGHVWRFHSGAQGRISKIQNEKDRLRWKSAQVPVIAWDQLEEFTEAQFWYLQSRLRSGTGIRPRVLATCNPVPDDDPIGGWLNELVSWWIDSETGYAIPERGGVVRWFYRISDELHWYDTREEAIEAHPDHYHQRTAGGEDRFVEPKSLTFIPATIDDNPIGESRNPEYRGTLLALHEIDMERLYRGNWKIRPTAGVVFNVAWLQGRFLDDLPQGITTWVRAWDKAGSLAETASRTAGVLIGMKPAAGGLPAQFYVTDCWSGRLELVEREQTIRAVAEADGHGVSIRIEQEGASGGKDSAAITIGNLAGFDVEAVSPVAEASEKSFATRVPGKVERFRPFAVQAKARNVWILNGPWVKIYLQRLFRFDGKGKDTDEADATALAFNSLALEAPGEIQIF